MQQTLVTGTVQSRMPSSKQLMWPLVKVTTEKDVIMPLITLPDGSQRNFDNPVSVIDVASDIGPGLAKATIAGMVNGREVDSSHIIDRDSELSYFDGSQ